MDEQVTDSQEEVQEQDASQAPNSEDRAGDSKDSLADDQAVQVEGLSEKQVREIVRSESQSVKDKRIAKLESAQEETSSRLDQYEQYRESGLSPAQAKKEIAVDEIIAERNAQPAQTEVSSGLTQSEAQSLAGSLISGLSADEQQTIMAQVNTKAFIDTSSLNQFVVSQVAAVKPVSSSATVSTPSAGEAKGQPSEGALLTEYTEKVIAARGKPDEIRALNAEYAELGLDIGGVVFTV